MIRNNILFAFQKIGIHPLNPDIFSEDECLITNVTDRPTSECSQTSSQTHSVELEKTPELIHASPESKTPPPHHADPHHKKISCKANKYSKWYQNYTWICKAIPHPKAEPRRSPEKREIRRPSPTNILTDAPEKEEIGNYEKENAEKVGKQSVKRRVVSKKETSKELNSKKLQKVMIALIPKWM